MTVRFTIDNIEVEAEQGEWLLDVANRNGFVIPSLCHHEALPPVASCRICLVEIRRGNDTQLVTSCNQAVEQGLEVITDSPAIQKHRAMNLELLLARAPGSNTIRDLANRYGVNRPRFGPLAYNPLPNCILCELCVRTCAHLGHEALNAVGRGDRKRIGLPFNKPAASCVGCASCASVCPTSCIKVTDGDRTRSIWGQEFAFVTCRYCNAPIITEKHRDYAIESKGLPEDYYDVCETCKQASTSKRFAAIVW